MAPACVCKSKVNLQLLSCIVQEALTTPNDRYHMPICTCIRTRELLSYHTGSRSVLGAYHSDDSRRCRLEHSWSRVCVDAQLGRGGRGVRLA